MNENNFIHSTSFWEIYSRLDDKEALDFIGFSGSGILGTNKQVKKLAVLCYELKQSGEKATKLSVYQQAFQKKSYHRQMMNNYLSDLKQLLTSYIQLNWINQKTDVQHFVLAEAYLKMGLLEQFENESEKTQSGNELLSADTFYYQIKTKQLVDEYQATQIKKRRYDLLEPVIDDFTTYFLLEKVRMYCELVNRKNLRNQDFDHLKMEQFLQFYFNENNTENTNLLLALYYSVLTFLRFPNDEAAYGIYKQKLQSGISMAHPQTARELCLYGQNQCIRHINKNNAFYLKELFDLYNLMLENNILYEGAYMTQYTFKNYVTVALRLKAFDEAEQFVVNYQNRLHPAQQFNAYHYNLAAVYFEENHYADAMKMLNAIQITDPVYYLDSRCILLKIYYHENDFEALASLYDSVRVYLLRLKQMPKKQSDLYKFLFLHTYKLSRIKLRSRVEPMSSLQPELHKLMQKIDTTDVANKGWLQSIASALVN
ncbi:MAG: hypothetical protein IPI65_20230 [Bacteroidetes bacterium]|nr:hypothetical protein [Bacteroidota bacterium]